ncbi:MAG TPA: RNA-directed DNA polymerase [Thiothrix sp.]|nr:RNA-directed DNA polymerase [Thiothrix sp.]
MSSTLESLWIVIEQAGGIDRYVDKELKAKGYLVERSDTASMSKRALGIYKKALKQESVEKRTLKKQAWAAYKQTHLVHLGEGIFWSDAEDEDKWDVENAHKRLLENQLPAITKSKQLAEALDISIAELRWLCYHREASTSSHYTRFEIPKRDGSSREIWAPRPLLKKVQTWILREILERLLVHGAAHGFLAGRSIATNASQHINSKILVKMDIEDFFPSISWKRVRGVFRKAGYQGHIATLLALLCTEAPRKIVEHRGKTTYVALGERCLPQGAPTSPALSNALCLSLDRRLTGVATKLGWRYSRYADDLAFSQVATKKQAPELTPLFGSIKRILGEEGFVVNQKKTHVVRQGARQEVTGLIVNGKGEPRVPRKLKRQLRAAVHNFKCGKPLRDGVSLMELKGYAAYIMMTDRRLGEEMKSVLVE